MRRPISVAVLSAALFVCLAGYRLAAPGLYYDEAHQVPAVFAWQGGPPGHFCRALIGGVPWLTMPYSGAIKPALFALVLDVSGAPFSIVAWRWFGVVLVAAGWIWCATVLGARWGPGGQLAFVALWLSDATVLLTTRHDWGPTALALALRCAFLAVWLRADRVSARAAFALGLVAGVALFEKLSSVVLLGPLLIALLGQPRRQVALGLLGVAVGASPLALVNVTTWGRGEGLISLAALTETAARSGWLAVTGGYLSLGRGDWVRGWILGAPPSFPLAGAEAVLMAAAMLLACARRESRRVALAYVAVGLGLVLLPRRTQAHHWIAGTPFQYAALAIAVATGGRAGTAARWLLALLLLLRLPVVVDTAAAIAATRTSPRFDPAPTRVAAFLAGREEALVVAATWGIANQIIACAAGRPGAVYEPIYGDDDVDAFRDVLARSDRTILYAVTVPSVAHLFPARTARVLAAIASDHRWREVAVDAELPATPLVRVRKFVRGDAAPAG